MNLLQLDNLVRSMFQNNSIKTQKKRAEGSSLVETHLVHGEALGSSLSPQGQLYVFQMDTHLEHYSVTQKVVA